LIQKGNLFALKFETCNKGQAESLRGELLVGGLNLQRHLLLALIWISRRVFLGDQYSHDDFVAE
jgi:hypothetical protein